MRNFIRLLILITIPLTSDGINAQVGIGTTSPTGALDITSSTDGLVIPRISLTATNVATVTTPTTSELVYNTATSGDVTPGFYYWDSTKWVRLNTGTNSSYWALTGNSGTTAGTNFIGTSDDVDFVGKTNNTERFRVLKTGNTGFGTTTPASTLSVAANATIGATYAPTNTAPSNGLRVEGHTVIGKSSGEDSRDKFSAHTSTSAYSNVTGYPNTTSGRAISGYADTNGMGVFGFSNRTGYGVVGLTKANLLSSYIQTGEGVLGQSDGATGGPTIPIGVHGIIDESTAGNWKANGVTGENNNLSAGSGFSGGSYAANGVASGVYGNYASKFPNSGTDAYVFGVSGDILKIGTAFIPDGSGGVFGSGGAGQFGMLGYNSLNGTQYSVYGGGKGGDINGNNNGTGRSVNDSKPNNRIGLGINGGFMGGYIKGNQYGVISKGEEFGMYVQGNTIINKPVVQLTENGNSERTISYTAASTTVDVTTRGTGKLTNGEAYITFKDAFKKLVSKNEGINVTVTPTSETNGVYVSRVSSDGFYIKENQRGTSNATFNWVAIGTKAGYENGIEISKTILAQDFDKNMDGVMTTDGSGKEGKPIYFDGQNIRFERIPESLIQYSKKVTPKK
ncbi:MULTISPECIES: hypothetical protein [Flavobacterium]|uniref:hypothetical protein n=1 Tax=Flavobacterium TaxID=237 RepID=UPI001FCC2178|nr:MULTISPECIES: hypothetical protein [Flavobacterium]UOK42598.1 hypothetical protein LZF87_00320 [Flavobacterium enshiense]